MSGRAAACQENDCPIAGVPTLIDDFRAMPGADAGSVAVITSWEKIASTAALDPAAATISTGRTGGTNLASLEADAQIVVGPGELGTERCKIEREGPADAGAGAGDHDHFGFEGLHAVLAARWGGGCREGRKDLWDSGGWVFGGGFWVM